MDGNECLEFAVLILNIKITLWLILWTIMEWNIEFIFNLYVKYVFQVTCLFNRFNSDPSLHQSAESSTYISTRPGYSVFPNWNWYYRFFLFKRNLIKLRKYVFKAKIYSISLKKKGLFVPCDHFIFWFLLWNKTIMYVFYTKDTDKVVGKKINPNKFWKYKCFRI